MSYAIMGTLCFSAAACTDDQVSGRLGRGKTACGATLQNIREIKATMTIFSLSTVYIASHNFATCKLMLFFLVSLMDGPIVDIPDHNR